MRKRDPELENLRGKERFGIDDVLNLFEPERLAALGADARGRLGRFFGRFFGRFERKESRTLRLDGRLRFGRRRRGHVLFFATFNLDAVRDDGAVARSQRNPHARSGNDALAQTFGYLVIEDAVWSVDKRDPRD